MEPKKKNESIYQITQEFQYLTNMKCCPLPHQISSSENLLRVFISRSQTNFAAKRLAQQKFVQKNNYLLTGSLTLNSSFTNYTHLFETNNFPPRKSYKNNFHLCLKYIQIDKFIITSQHVPTFTLKKSHNSIFFLQSDNT